MEKTFGGIRLKFSVLIPVYNTEKYLEECLQSVLNQTYQDFEIVIVDDGSIDSSGKLCDDFQDKHSDRTKVIHQSNSGQLVSRINAIKAAIGDYCLFLDADDLLVENALQIIYQRVIEYKAPDLILFPFFYERKGRLEKSRLLCQEEKLYQKDDIKNLQQIFFSDVLLNSMCTKAAKRSVLENSILDYEKFSNLRCSEDRLQSMWILDNISSAYFITEPLYIYRLFEGSTTRTYSVTNIGKFNTSVLYSEEKKYLLRWGLNTDSWIHKFLASQITYLVYVFDLFYMNVKKATRPSIIDYQWSSFLPDEIGIDEIKKNEMIPKIQKKLAIWIFEKNLKEIKVFYTKKRLYQKARYLKRKVFKQSGKKQ